MTRDARQHPAGTVEVQGQWLFDNGHDVRSRHGDSYSARTVAAVKRWAGQHIPLRPADEPEGHWWIHVERGTWTDSSFTDDEYGWVIDVEWVTDDSLQLVGHATAVRDGLPAIQWEDWS